MPDRINASCKKVSSNSASSILREIDDSHDRGIGVWRDLYKVLLVTFSKTDCVNYLVKSKLPSVSGYDSNDRCKDVAILLHGCAKITER